MRKQCFTSPLQALSCIQQVQLSLLDIRDEKRQGSWAKVWQLNYTAEQNMIHNMKRQSHIQSTAVCVSLWSCTDDS